MDTMSQDPVDPLYSSETKGFCASFPKKSLLYGCHGVYQIPEETAGFFLHHSYITSTFTVIVVVKDRIHGCTFVKYSGEDRSELLLLSCLGSIVSLPRECIIYFSFPYQAILHVKSKSSCPSALALGIKG
jgi:hypothetical protein